MFWLHAIMLFVGNLLCKWDNDKFTQFKCPEIAEMDLLLPHQAFKLRNAKTLHVW